MEIRHILFKEIRFWISLNNQPKYSIVKRLLFEKEKSRKKIFPFQSMPNLHFAKVQLKQMGPVPNQSVQAPN